MNKPAKSLKEGELFPTFNLPLEQIILKLLIVVGATALAVATLVSRVS